LRHFALRYGPGMGLVEVKDTVGKTLDYRAPSL
jgi:hypothetical protein